MQSESKASKPTPRYGWNGAEDETPTPTHTPIPITPFHWSPDGAPAPSGAMLNHPPYTDHVNIKVNVVSQSTPFDLPKPNKFIEVSADMAERICGQDWSEPLHLKFEEDQFNPSMLVMVMMKTNIQQEVKEAKQEANAYAIQYAKALDEIDELRNQLDALLNESGDTHVHRA